ncbi:MAG: hypothetical protein J7K53_12095 [Bacteroidales bacterium]|nr:hypothetical protein [Bacteroidales bacterium]
MAENSYSDKDLLQIFNAGENPDYAFGLIVKRYQEKLYWHIRKIVISHEDADAEILDTSVGALKASYHHAVKKIKEFLTND